MNDMDRRLERQEAAWDAECERICADLLADMTKQAGRPLSPTTQGVAVAVARAVFFGMLTDGYRKVAAPVPR